MAVLVRRFASLTLGQLVRVAVVGVVLFGAGWLLGSSRYTMASLRHAVIFVLRAVVSTSVAAAVVLWLGVRKTASVTLTVAGDNRDSAEKTAADRLDHEQKAADNRIETERRAATLDRIFAQRAGAFIVADKILRNHLLGGADAVPLTHSKAFQESLSDIAVLGGPDAADLYHKAGEAVNDYNQSRHDSSDTEVQSKALVRAEREVTEFERLARAHLGLDPGPISTPT